MTFRFKIGEWIHAQDVDITLQVLDHIRENAFGYYRVQWKSGQQGRLESSLVDSVCEPVTQ